MSRAIFILPEAVEEAIAARQWYERHTPGAASGFVWRLREAYQVIAERPTSVASFHGPVRRLRLKRYPFSVLFRCDEERIEILAVAHNKRQPGYWKDRKPSP